MNTPQSSSMQSLFDVVFKELQELIRYQAFGDDLFPVVEDIDHRGGCDIVLLMVIARQGSWAIHIDPFHFFLPDGQFPFDK
jgi:hypothetical protein